MTKTVSLAFILLSGLNAWFTVTQEPHEEVAIGQASEGVPE